MRALLLAFALALASPAPARADDFLLFGVGSGGGGAYGPIVTPTVTPQASALFPPDNSVATGAAINSGLEFNGGAQGAGYVPSTVTNSWFLYIEGTVDPNFAQTGSSAVEYLATGRASAIGCTNTSCTGGSDHYLEMLTPGVGASFEIGSQIKASTTAVFWQGGSIVASAFTAGSGYTNGLYAWTASGSACTVAPSGWIGVGWSTSGAIAAVRTTFAGSGCPTSGTYSVPLPAGVGAGSSGAITLTYGYATGIQARPGQHFCGVIGQYGQESANVSAGIAGYQFAAFVDNAGTALSGSPVIAATNIGSVSNQGTVSFNGTTTTSSTTLTVNSVSSGTLYPGQTIAGTGVTSAAITVQLTGTTGGAGTYTLSASQATGVGPEAMTAANEFYYTNTTGTARTQAAIGDIVNLVGSTVTTGGAHAFGWGGELGPVGMIWGIFPNTAGTPSASVLSQLCTKASNTDPLAYFTTNDAVRSFYRFNTTSWTDSSTGNSGSPWAAATAVSPAPTLGTPAAPGPALTITDNGPYTVYPVALGGAYGSITVKGTFNTAALGGAPSAIQAQISSTPGGAALSGCSPSCAWTTIATAPTGGVYSGLFSGVPPGGPYYVAVRAANGTGYVISTNPVEVGLVIGVIGQSQMTFAFGPTSSLGMSYSLASGVAATQISTQINNGGSAQNTVWAQFLPATPFGGMPVGNADVRPLTTYNVNATTASATGEGATAFANALAALSTWPVEIVNFNRSGNPAGTWANGYVPQTQALSGGGTATVSGTLAFAISSLGLGSSPPYADAAASVVLGGTFAVYNGATEIAYDAATSTIGVGSSTNCVGMNGYTVSSCSINYTTGVVSVTFTANAPASPTAKWTNIVDIAVGGTGLAAVSGNQYDGTDNFGNGTAASGYVSAVMAKTPSALTMMMAEQCTANESTFSTYSYANAATSQSAFWSYILGTKFPNTFAQYLSATPVLSLGYPRDFEALGSTAWNQINGCWKWTRDFGTSGSGYAYSGSGSAGYGGSYGDISNQDTSTYSLYSPHGNIGFPGLSRIGRRAAANVWGFFKSSTLASEPAVSTTKPSQCDSSASVSPCFDVSSAGCSGTAGVSSNCIDIAFTLNPAATSLATCGTNISGGTHPATGSCSVTTAAGTNVEGFRIGPASTTLYFNDGLDAYNNTYNAAATSHNEFTCAILTATVVQCVKATGSWSAGSTYLSYGDQDFASRNGVLAGTKTGTGYTVTTAGSCTGNTGSPATVSLTGATGGTHASLLVTFTTAGISSVVPKTPGAISGTTADAMPTSFTATSTCTGYTVTGVAIGTAITDDNLLGQYLYDNSAAIGTTLNPIFSGSGASGAACNVNGFCEPGLPVTPYGVITPVAVSG